MLNSEITNIQKELNDEFLKSVIKQYNKKLKFIIADIENHRLNSKLTQEELDFLNITKNFFSVSGQFNKLITKELQIIFNKVIAYVDENKNYSNYLKKEKDKFAIKLIQEVTPYKTVLMSTEFKIKKLTETFLKDNYSETLAKLDIKLNIDLVDDFMSYLYQKEKKIHKLENEKLYKMYLLYMFMQTDSDIFNTYLSENSTIYSTMSYSDFDKKAIFNYFRYFFKNKITTRVAEEELVNFLDSVSINYLQENLEFYKGNLTITETGEIVFNSILIEKLNDYFINKLSSFLNRTPEVLLADISKNRENKLDSYSGNDKDFNLKEKLNDLYVNVYKNAYANWYHINVFYKIKKGNLITYNSSYLSLKLPKKSVILEKAYNHIRNYDVTDESEMEKILLSFMIRYKIKMISNSINEDKLSLEFKLSKSDLVIILNEIIQQLIQNNEQLSRTKVNAIFTYFSNQLPKFSTFKELYISDFTIENGILDLDKIKFDVELNYELLFNYIARELNNIPETIKGSNSQLNFYSLFNNKYSKLLDSDIKSEFNLLGSKNEFKIYNSSKPNTIPNYTENDLNTIIIDDDLSLVINKELDNLLIDYDKLGYTFDKQLVIRNSIHDIKSLYMKYPLDEFISDLKFYYLEPKLVASKLIPADILKIKQCLKKELKNINITNNDTVNRILDSYIKAKKETIIDYKIYVPYLNETQFNLELNLDISDYVKSIKKSLELKNKKSLEDNYELNPVDIKRLKRLALNLDRNKLNKTKNAEYKIIDNNLKLIQGSIETYNKKVKFTPTLVVCYNKLNKKIEQKEIKIKSNETILSFWKRVFPILSKELGLLETYEWEIFKTCINQSFDLRKSITS